MNRKAWVIAAALLAAGTAQATCYSVYKADGLLIQESSTTPVNLALAIGDTVPEKFGPGATMTMSDHGVYCKDRRETQAAKKSLAEAVRAEGETAQQVAGAREATAAKTESARD